LFQKNVSKNFRRYNSHVGPYNINYNLLINPWVPLLWSVMFPGFGHLLLGAYLDGYLLIIWEIGINNMSHLNQAIIYTFHGKYELAKSVLSVKWAILYLPVYLFSMWDSYRTTVETNYMYYLAEKENARVVPYQISGVSISYLDKINPLMSVVWTCCVPGLGHIIMHRLLTGVFLFVWWLVICHFSNLTSALYYTLIGSFTQAIQILQPQWLLFMPSLYGYAIFETYTSSVELTKLFKIEQTQHFQSNYQSTVFKLPGKEK
jgi:hypothetical protein